MSCGKGGCGGPCGLPCADKPEDIRCPRMCLTSISKNLRGDVLLIDVEKEECGEPRCVTLKLINFAQMRATSNEPCDTQGAQGGLFDGTLKLYDLIHAFIDGSPETRGWHGASFRLEGPDGTIDGTFSGLTNANTFRDPFNGEHGRECRVQNVMEGRFCGTVQRAGQEQLVGAQAIGTYRLFAEKGFMERNPPGLPIYGTLEGVIVVTCTK
jgi:hypothetical protein